MHSTQAARVRVLQNAPVRREKPFVAYWCYSALRGRCNHALEYAVHSANKYELPLVVFCALGKTGLRDAACARQARFALEALPDFARACEERNLLFLILASSSQSAAAAYMAENAALLVVDAVYLKREKRLFEELQTWSDCPVVQVESGVVVPLHEASPKEEYSAATLRPKIRRQLLDYLKPVQVVQAENPSKNLSKEVSGSSKTSGASGAFFHPSLAFPKVFRPRRGGASYEIRALSAEEACSEAFIASLKLPSDSSAREGIAQKIQRGGEQAAQRALAEFTEHRLFNYAEQRNDPSKNGQSRISAYLKFGVLSPVDAALQALEASEAFAAERAANPDEEFKMRESAEAYLEELIIRRELACNFAEYNPDCETYEKAVPGWAQATLASHQQDARLSLYGFDRMEKGETEDECWNAAQNQLRESGAMHGYMRMYWAKKILEWCKSPQEAFAFTVVQNDRYATDGFEPNGYAGIAWCYGKHDRPWFDKPIFGLVRPMTASGIRRKFKNIDEYIRAWT